MMDTPDPTSPPARRKLIDEVHAGLSMKPRQLPPKLLYDAEGSRLFDGITELPEYYPTRTEASIMAQHAAEMCALIGPDALLFELGSGSSTKTRYLLDHIDNPVAYVPIDISREHLLASAERIREHYPELKVIPLAADYSAPMALPETDRIPRRRVAYYPGSTIGNFHPEPAGKFLETIALLAERGGGILIGVDLQKDAAILEPAYNDSKGVTAAFNLNLLARINREADANFDLSAFRHHAFYDPDAGRIEMHLVSLQNQWVTVAGERYHFDADESIRTECSYKYTIEGFEQLAECAGLVVEKVWTDPAQLFSVQYLRVP